MHSISPLQPIRTSFHKFLQQEYTGGIVLLLSVLAAIIWFNCNTPSYHDVWHTPVNKTFAGHSFTQPLHEYINDGLMAIFFFVIGLELKREFLSGELATASKALLPVVAAFGGMIVPALFYILFNHGLPSSHGWGIPMATDIAFALGLLSLAGRHIPVSVKVFLSALAVADDLGAILVIALCYTHQIAWLPLCAGLFIILLLGLINRLGLRRPAVYLLAGTLVWYCFLLSGIHATIAGVLVAFTLPAKAKSDTPAYSTAIRKYFRLSGQKIPLNVPCSNTLPLQLIRQIRILNQDTISPLQKTEHALHPWVAFLIMPLFALANAGMPIGADLFSALSSPVSAGVGLGLLCGKFIGVLGATWLMVQLKWAALPDGSSWQHLAGIALLAGVGFTMSLFITGLAFVDQESMIIQAKYGILAASVLAGILGITVLKRAS